MYDATNRSSRFSTFSLNPGSRISSFSANHSSVELGLPLSRKGRDSGNTTAMSSAAAASTQCDGQDQSSRGDGAERDEILAPLSGISEGREDAPPSSTVGEFEEKPVYQCQDNAAIVEDEDDDDQEDDIDKTASTGSSFAIQVNSKDEDSS